ncbi:MAG: hypothetical protein KTR33_04500 [Gammaproteobacteria bacterium]|nr:hypothetical protein [Gammaproteobacteria bacterium]
MSRFYPYALLSMLLALVPAQQLFANEVAVVDVTISANGGGSYRVNVTLLHEDAGWDHYANRWDVLDETGKVLGSRVLAHPHDNEQPFTRSLTLNIPDTVKTITIRANDSVHETGGAEMSIEVPH